MNTPTVTEEDKESIYIYLLLSGGVELVHKTRKDMPP
jgi:hypothetical protein